MKIYINGESVEVGGGKDATINGQNALEIVAGENVSLQQKDGVLTISALAGDAFPSGGIIVWSGAANAIPNGWALCDGANGTPDLRDRFVLGSGGRYAVGAKGGAESVTLRERQLPPHDHTLEYQVPAKVPNMTGILAEGYLQTSTDDRKNLTIRSVNAIPRYFDEPDPVEIMPPYYALCYIMKR